MLFQGAWLDIVKDMLQTTYTYGNSKDFKSRVHVKNEEIKRKKEEAERLKKLNASGQP